MNCRIKDNCCLVIWVKLHQRRRQMFLAKHMYLTMHCHTSEDGDTRWRSWFRLYATIREVAVSIRGTVIFLQAALWLWGPLSLWHKWVPLIFSVKTADVLQLSCTKCLDIWEPHSPGTLRNCPGLQRDCFVFTKIFKTCVIQVLQMFNIRWWWVDSALDYLFCRAEALPSQQYE
jgi:hypothetical protein